MDREGRRGGGGHDFNSTTAVSQCLLSEALNAVWMFGVCFGNENRVINEIMQQTANYASYSSVVHHNKSDLM